MLGLVAGTSPPGAGRWGDRVGSLVRLAGGLALVLVPLLGAVVAIGGEPALRGLYRDVVRDSFGFVDFAKTWPIFGSELGVFFVAAFGLILVLRVRGVAILRHPVHGALLLPTLTTVVILLLPQTPAVYQHAWLPLLPVVAVYAGLAIATLVEWARREPSRWRTGVVVAAIVAAVVVPAGESLIFAVRDQNAAELALMRGELRLACPGEAVLDGTALFVFRPAAYRYGTLIRGVREWVARGVVAEEVIADDIRAARAPVAHVDFRILGMIGPLADVLRRHYVEGPDKLLVAGAHLVAPDGGGRSFVDLLVPGPYLLYFTPELEVAIDGAPARRGLLTMTAGQHEVTWRGPAGAIRLVAASCPERQTPDGRGA